MAINMCSSESSDLITSPRISFSYDLCNMEDCQLLPLSDSTYCTEDSNHDLFNFSFSEIVEKQASSADELFSDGLIRPLRLGEKFATQKNTSLPPLPPSTNECSSKETISINVIERETKHHSKSFWRARRSNSVQCDSSRKKSSFWSLPLLLRSNSTGSVTQSRRQMSKDIHKQNSHKQPKHTSSSSRYTYELSQKPPLKKNNGEGSYGNGNGVWISPVLNMPPPYIGKGTAFNLFGFGYLFRNKKEKKNK